VTDSGNLLATVVLNVAVTNETTPPVINPITNVVVKLPSNSSVSSIAGNFPLPTATDNCSTPTVVTSRASGSVFNVGTTTVTVTATDAAGNVATSSFTVRVVYNLPGLCFGKTATITDNSPFDRDLRVGFIRGSNNPDVIIGSDNAEIIDGAEGDDLLNGGEGNDMLTGNEGADCFNGGQGNDTATDCNAAQGDWRNNTVESGACSASWSCSG
jgi:Ca2+-binding RTX toxin-like protein